jgi:hypothetical protein
LGCILVGSTDGSKRESLVADCGLRNIWFPKVYANFAYFC